jgi:hypothetical protein
LLLATALLVAPAFLPPAAAATDPNPRSPALSAGGTITAFALARTSGWVAAGIADPGGGLGSTNPTANVWTVWDETGQQKRTGDADKANCLTTPLEACQADVVAIALSASGTRVAVLAVDRGKETGRVIFATSDQGVVSRQEIGTSQAGEAPTSLAMSPDGTRVAVGTSSANGVNADTGHVHLYTWGTSGGGAVAQQWSTATPAPVTDVAIGESGTSTQVVAAAGTTHVRFKADASGTAVTHSTGTAVTYGSVAFAEASAKKWDAAGLSDGTLQVYSTDGETDPFAPNYDLHPDTQAVGAVAIAKAGTFVLSGDNGGKVRLYRNPDVTGLAAGPVKTTPALDGAVAALALSADDRYAAVAAGKTVQLYRAGTEQLDLLWTAALGATVPFVGVTEDGATVAAASGSTVTVYTTVRSVTTTAPANAVVEAGKAANLTLSVRNDGNREESPTFELSLPADWVGSVTSPITLLPGTSGSVTVQVTPAASQAAGAARFTVIQRLAGIPTNVPVDVQVAQRHLLTLLSDDAPNRAVQPGATLSYKLDVQNLGNGKETTAIEVAVDNPDWKTGLSPSSLTLDPGASGSATVTLTAPAGAKQLDAAHLTVTLAADRTASLRFAATVGGRFGVTVDKLDTVGVQQGASQTLTLTVHNTGNTADTYTVTAGGLPEGWTLAFPSNPPRVENLGAGASVGYPVTLTLPADATGSRTLVFQVASLADPSQKALVPVTVIVQGTLPTGSTTSTSTSGSGGSPGPELGLVAAAVVVLALVRKGRQTS